MSTSAFATSVRAFSLQKPCIRRVTREPARVQCVSVWTNYPAIDITDLDDLSESQILVDIAPVSPGRLTFPFLVKNRSEASVSAKVRRAQLPFFFAGFTRMVHFCEFEKQIVSLWAHICHASAVIP